MSSKANEMDHISEELLERYSLQHLSEEQLAPIEEHLLICAVCQLKLDEVDEYIAVTKMAARQMIEKQAPARDLRVAPRRPLQWALPLAAGAAISVLLMVMIRPAVERGGQSSGQQSEVTLAATRGVSATGTAQVKAHSTVLIKAEAPDVPAGSALRLELADGRGAVVWKGAGAARDGQIQALVNSPLDAGLYWLRVYEGEKLRQEYGLEVK